MTSPVTRPFAVRTKAHDTGKASASIEMLPQEDPLPWVTPAAASADLTLGWAK